jgi:hypothetical protein
MLVVVDVVWSHSLPAYCCCHGVWPGSVTAVLFVLSAGHIMRSARAAMTVAGNACAKTLLVA